MKSADEIIKHFGLIPHEKEGGYFFETYRSEEMFEQSVLPGRYDGNRNASTAIYYLLTPETRSHLHRLKSDEIFHFYLGDPITMLQLLPDGGSKTITLGQDLQAGQVVQLAVPKNTWQGSFLNEGGNFALLGCTVSPGFEFDDYETGKREELISQYPEEEKLITHLTRE